VIGQWLRPPASLFALSISTTRLGPWHPCMPMTTFFRLSNIRARCTRPLCCNPFVLNCLVYNQPPTTSSPAISRPLLSKNCELLHKAAAVRLQTPKPRLACAFRLRVQHPDRGLANTPICLCQQTAALRPAHKRGSLRPSEVLTPAFFEAPFSLSFFSSPRDNNSCSGRSSDEKNNGDPRSAQEAQGDHRRVWKLVRTTSGLVCPGVAVYCGRTGRG
jgi:hypothetical protein